MDKQDWINVIGICLLVTIISLLALVVGYLLEGVYGLYLALSIVAVCLSIASLVFSLLVNK